MNRFRIAMLLLSIFALIQLSGCASPNMKLSQPADAISQAPQDKAFSCGHFMNPAAEIPKSRFQLFPLKYFAMQLR